MVSVACFGVSVSVMFHLIFVHYILLKTSFASPIFFSTFLSNVIYKYTKNIF